MELSTEIERWRAEIRSDGYAMSVGELITLYRDNELDIHPEFQRYYRWTPLQKTRLIESLLLGIPLPSIFVAQQQNGVWDVIDGLQRLSTIFQMVGVLRDEKDKQVPPLRLEGTKYLPTLHGKKWESDNPDEELGVDNQLLIKRAKIDVKIVLRESSESSKYELFQRLNTGGSQLTDQELRNCVLIAANRDAFQWLETLRDDENFKLCLALTDRAILEQYDTELVVRFLVFRRLAQGEFKNIGDIGEFLTERLVNLGENLRTNPRLKEREESAFRLTFKVLAQELGDNSFKRFDVYKERYLGGFLLSTFEAIALGIGYNYRALRTKDGWPALGEKSRALWTNDIFQKYSGSGVRASSRIPEIIPLGRGLFAP